MQYDLFEPPKPEEEKESRKTELSQEEHIEIARMIYRVFRDDIEEIKDIETGDTIYKAKDTKK